MLKLAIDIDNVVVDFFSNFVTYCKENTTDFKDEMRIKALVSGFNYRFDIEDPKFVKIFKDFTNQRGHARSPFMCDDMEKVFYRIYGGAPLSCFVTSRPLKTQIETKKYLIDKFDVLKNTPVLYSSSEYRKAEVIKDIGGVTHFIDDQVAYIKEVAWTNPEVKCLWFNAYEMPSSVCPTEAIEMNDWDQVLKHLGL